jgi:hypothetical protein
VKWVATLSAQKKDDAERLLSQEIKGLSEDPKNPRQLVLTLLGPESEEAGAEESTQAGARIDALVERLNGIGKLRWGRTFEDISIAVVRSFDARGKVIQHVTVGTAVEHMLPEDYADMIERLGHPRPALPKGLDVVNGLDLAELMDLSDAVPEATRAMHLVALMLRGDDEIDWTAGYAALEIVEHDLSSRGLKGQELGWWTNGERDDFRATANSPEVLGYSARHGKPSGLPKARMTTKEAIWFVRRVVAQWLTSLSAEQG